MSGGGTRAGGRPMHGCPGAGARGSSHASEARVKVSERLSGAKPFAPVVDGFAAIVLVTPKITEQRITLLGLLGVVRCKEDVSNAAGKPLAVRVQHAAVIDRLLQVGLEVAGTGRVVLAPLLRRVRSPEGHVQEVLILDPALFLEPARRVRLDGRERVGGPSRKPGQRLVRPGGVSVAPAHAAPGGGRGREEEGIPVRIASHVIAPGVPGHPVHWHDGMGVVLRGLCLSTVEEVVQAVVDPLVCIEGDARFHLCEKHGCQLVEVEGLPSFRPRVPGVHQYEAGEALRRPGRRNVRPEVCDNDRLLGEVVD
mmetsp:Transcript_11249/g.35768  ORF Transcript_11249/g.35768 Transcript_11249/m.35768 type:complete len:310 (-) Transcript_11249:269-1198(-)